MTCEQIPPPTESQDMHRAQEVIKMHTNVIGAAYEKATAYTNLIIVAGYAGFFALWQITKDYLSRNQVLWAALLLLISLTVFVLFEVYKAYYSSRTLLHYGEILNNPENQGSLESLIKLQAEIEEYLLDEQKRAVRINRHWHMVFIVTVLSGLSGAGILVYALVRALCA